MKHSEVKGESLFERLAATLATEGTLWLESAFCNEPEGGALLFSDPLEVVTLPTLNDIELFFRRIEEQSAAGFHLAGWLTYEAGYAFEERLLHGLSPDDPHLPPSPLGWFGVYREPERFSAAEVQELFAEPGPRSDLIITDLSFNLSEEEYGRKIERIKEQIAAGNLYQVNFTGRYRFTSNSEPTALFAALRGRQPSSYTACINSGGRTILSCSPELFFRRRGSLIETMPMKGTAPRGRTIEEDNRLREGLAGCQKNRAENLMIVDLLRNDLGRICKPGTVEAGDLFTIETWPTLHQLLSTIRGELREGIKLSELFRALYPSGSITGAPKISAMKLIQSLEPTSRGIYTGTIGYITPDSEMVFSVAIRTIELSGKQGTYGSGGGIVWDSDPQDEYRECQLKAKILTNPGRSRSAAATETGIAPGSDRAAQQPEEHRIQLIAPASAEDVVLGCNFGQTDAHHQPPGGVSGSEAGQHFGLFESLLWNGNYLWLDEHLQRLAASAATLGFPCDTAAATHLLHQLEEEMRHHGSQNSNPQPGQQQEHLRTEEQCRGAARCKVRLSLTREGSCSASYEPITVQGSTTPLRLCIAAEPTHSSNPLLRHKTTKRELYDHYFTLARQQGYDEILFHNERGEITEGAISTIFIRKGQQLCTPPLHCGLLNGIFRHYILATRPTATEKIITINDLATADAIFIANSVRGLRPATMCKNPPTMGPDT
ncbi:aminodeoxychorismate synthase component I [Pelodictyon phaeoclathratiforme]|uniref:aminodeoxychorismate synthase component I n=1 Tax=Pelodictyon phaeoclathratiforme TaxID=34090 RepID=UPI001CC0E1B2|nr:aminodeoxychorismate synthase component I [Pelodictyon phaeoclathratiforme]